MAYYDYECQQCDHKFTIQESFAEHDQHRPVKCPSCGSRKVEQVLTPAYAQTSKKS